MTRVLRISIRNQLLHKTGEKLQTYLVTGGQDRMTSMLGRVWLAAGRWALAGSARRQTGEQLSSRARGL